SSGPSREPHTASAITGSPKTMLWAQRYCCSRARCSIGRASSSASEDSTGVWALAIALGKSRCPISRPLDRIDELLDRHAIPIEKDRCLAGGKIDLDLVYAGLRRQRLLEGLLALVAVHALDPDNRKLVVAHILGHKNLRRQYHRLSRQFVGGNPEIDGRHG